MSKSQDSFILVAAIAGAFGVRGEVKLKCFTDAPKSAVSYGPLLDDRGQTLLTVTGSRAIKGGLAVKTREVTSREQAESLKSTKLYVPRSALPKTDEDEFYITDLISLSVRNMAGEDVGRIAAVQDFGGGDLVEIRPSKGKTYFVPFTRDEVPRVSVDEGFIVIDPMETIEAKDPKGKESQNA